ncbi:MAG: endolytic transglycosylase MltG [Alphaproteobacteria bacterium]
MDDPETEPESVASQEKPHRRGLKVLRGAILGFLLVVVLTGGGIAGLYYWALQVHHAPGPLGQETTVVVEPGTGVQAIAERLSDAGVIERPEIFVVMLRVTGQHTRLKAGEYAFPPGISQAGAAAMLVNNDIVSRRITIPEGLTVVEIFAIIEATDGLTGDLPAERPPEGTLLPETYNFTRGDTRVDIVQRMSDAMDATLASLWAERAEGLPIDTPEQAVVLASIVEKETGLAGERPHVASVFINRLNRGMRLQSDPTVVYALTEGLGPLGRALTRRDWEVDHPYNTYQISGLPPGPIANPGADAIRAVLQPLETDDLYFVADGTGGHAFARTLDEHNRNVARWRRIRDSGE